MHEYLKLNHSIYHTSCYIHDISNKRISIYANIFHNVFGMTVYVNISVIYPLIQADPSRPTYPLCVPTAWGILISRQNCLLWSQAHMYFNSLRPSDHMAAKFWSSLLQPGLGSNTFYQIQIQIQIQKFWFFKYKYKYKYFVQHWFKYKYKYKYIDSNTNTNTNTFNQIYLPKLFRSKIGQFYESQDICSWHVFPYV